MQEVLKHQTRDILVNELAKQAIVSTMHIETPTSLPLDGDDISGDFF